MSKRLCYMSFAHVSGMLAVWLDERPVAGALKKPDGWCSNTSGTEYEARRLAELAHAPDVEIVLMGGTCAAEWAKSESERLSAKRKLAGTAAKKQQTLIPIPEDIETLGREVAEERLSARAKRGRAR